MGAQRAVHLEKALHLVNHLVKMAGLIAIRSGERIAVHRVRLPNHLVPRIFHRPNHAGQHLPHLIVPHAGHHGQPARHPVRIQLLRVRHRFLGGDRWADLNANRIGDERGEIHMEVVNTPGALPDPQLMCGQVIKLGFTVLILGQPQHGTLVIHKQRLVGCENICGTQAIVRHTARIHEPQAAFDLLC